MKPSLESLEKRDCPAVIANPNFDLLFVGADPNQAQMTQLVSFCASNVMPQLLACYGVGQGTLGTVDAIAAPGSTLDDTGNSGYPTQLQQLLGNEIAAGRLPQPDANQFYIVFGAPGIQVEANLPPFLGYHSASGNEDYAVIPYPGGVNPINAGWTAEQTLETTTTHEIEEGLMNFTSGIPNNGEIADPFNQQYFTDGGYRIQIVEGPDGNPMTINNAPPAPPPPATFADLEQLALDEFRALAFAYLARLDPVFEGQAEQFAQAVTQDPALLSPFGQFAIIAAENLFEEIVPQ